MRWWLAAILIAVPFLAQAQDGPGLAVPWISSGDGTYAMRCPTGGEVCDDSPTSAYAYPNGIWLSGYFNDDHQTDFVHVVEGADYVQTWLSSGPSFTVGAFSPWPGYWTSNGVWLTGFFNNDRRTDIIHLVAGTDVANVWMSNGDGTFAVSTFRPWPGYAISRGVWLIDDKKDGMTALVHVVAGTDYVHIWTPLGDGTFHVLTFCPWAGYDVSKGSWLIGDFDGDHRMDLAHVIPGAVNIWYGEPGYFIVKPFLPWDGYITTKGVWLAADFNGDGKTDIVHAVEGTSVVNVWTSMFRGAFDVVPFSPWLGYEIPNGRWYTADVDRDGRSDIVHAVNSDLMNTWISSKTKTFDVRSFRPWSGYPIGDGIWLVRDIDTRFFRWAELMHIVPINPARFLAVARHTKASISEGEADRIMTDATRVLWTVDGSTDTACGMRMARDGGIATFDVLGTINSSLEFKLLGGPVAVALDLHVPGFVKVVNQINWCGDINPNILGCSPTPGNYIAVVRTFKGTITEGVLWAHEFGHTRGLEHRDDADADLAVAVMNLKVTPAHLRVSPLECFFLRK